jgi:molecular chaperone DnaJ
MPSNLKLQIDIKKQIKTKDEIMKEYNLSHKDYIVLYNKLLPRRKEISFEEMVKGVSKDINLYKNATCDACSGSGGEPGANEETCKTCQGRGRIRKAVRSILGTIQQEVACPECQGKGKTFSEKCKKCSGKGVNKEEKHISVKVPAGIQNGQTISMQGEGAAPEGGGINGDLYINVHVRPHDQFERKGNDIYSERHITFPQAVLGDNINIETIEGSVSMKIPKGTQSGELFRIRSKGVPMLQGGERGHHVVRIVVDIPKKINRQEKKLVEELRDLRG